LISGFVVVIIMLTGPCTLWLTALSFPVASSRIVVMEVRWLVLKRCRME